MQQDSQCNDGFIALEWEKNNWLLGEGGGEQQAHTTGQEEREKNSLHSHWPVAQRLPTPSEDERKHIIQTPVAKGGKPTEVCTAGCIYIYEHTAPRLAFHRTLVLNFFVAGVTSQ